ncbi:hypothetical protein N7541_007760 [Penicillium brevicompactum]|uniref:Uncharacterized protein n=1 Tax=Penicillium brevicompactum TaxID=5074 RepID=A0A9W9UM08_PENBR|nr:hypothetical protein N7541_007760 [Penicillium brevicompactum]
MFGSHEAIGLDHNVCVDRYSRYGPYGLDEFTDADVPGFQRPPRIFWGNINWGYLQSSCYERNADRYDPDRPDQHYSRHVLSLYPPESASRDKWHKKLGTLSYKPRSAVLLRASDSMKWTPSHAQYLRSLIMELSLHSGSEYQVFFLVDVHSPIDLENDEEGVQTLKQKIVPAEFRNMTVLFNERLLERWYPKVDEHRAIYQHLQATQVFSLMYPEFDYYWQLEFDNRIIAHAYHFFEQAIDFAKRQPRKYLWERNAYFYTPGAHGDWSDFSNMVTLSMEGKQSIWGPLEYPGITPAGPTPPVSRPQADHFEWGVGEEADLITFLPIFDPKNTSWTFPWMIWNLDEDIPRRTSVITQWRVSKRLLREMHNAQLEGQAFASEMSAPSWTLLHGFKAVHVPQPIYVDGKWTSAEMSRIFNRGAPENINGDSNSIWNWDHKFDYLWYRISFMFATQTAEDLFRRWSGYPPNPARHLSGERVSLDISLLSIEMLIIFLKPEYRPGRYWDESGSLVCWPRCQIHLLCPNIVLTRIQDEPANGRMCLPFMLLHTIKNTEPDATSNLPVTDSALQDDAI